MNGTAALHRFQKMPGDCRRVALVDIFMLYSGIPSTKDHYSRSGQYCRYLYYSEMLHALNLWAMSETSVVLTWRPGNKPGVYIQKKHYDLVRTHIVSLLNMRETIELSELIEEVQTQLTLPDVNLAWMLLQVKLDLEAKGMIKVRVIGPNRLQLISIKRGKQSRTRYLAGI